MSVSVPIWFSEGRASGVFFVADTLRGVIVNRGTTITVIWM